MYQSLNTERHVLFLVHSWVYFYILQKEYEEAIDKMVETFQFPHDIRHKARQLFNIAYSTEKFYAVRTKNKIIIAGKCNLQFLSSCY